MTQMSINKCMDKQMWYIHAADYCFVQLLSRVLLCDTMGCSTLGFPVLQHLPELAQTHVH